MLHSFNSNPVCPYCEFEDSDQIQDMDLTDEAENMLTCSNCGKEYKVYVRVTYSFDTFVKE